MKPEMLVILGIFFSFGLIEFFRTDLFHKKGQTGRDGIFEVASILALILVTQPFALFMGGLVAALVAPNAAGALAGLPFIAGFALFLIFDDLTQYWWHRASHSIPWLYKLHRPHHDAAYMSIRVVYRNNIFYYALMPGLWLSGALVYLGLGWVYAVYIVVKMAVIYGAHSDVRWDRPLYANKFTAPLMWVVERVISTPATHHAHHGKHKSDGVTHYKGNYGNLLFFWDVLFGTALITRRYPTEFGVENLPETSLGEQLVWPLLSTGNKIPSPAESPAS